jgi:hypothetical protein
MQAWTIRPDGSDLSLISPASPVYEPIWSPDGKALACTGAGAEFSLIDLAQPLAARRPVPAGPAGRGFAPFDWERDPRLPGERGRLAGVHEVTPGILVYSFAKRKLERITNDAARVPAWLHDHRNIIYLLDGSIMVVNVDSHVSRRLLAPPADSEFVFVSPGPDDHLLYTVRSIKEGNIWLGAFQ